jgi:imidazoleglycerol-phosphate dehydratase
VLRIERSRKTRETDVTISVDFDGSGDSDVATALPFFDHLLTSMAKHGRFDLRLKAKGDLEVDDHHVVEDVAIVLGECLSEGQKARGAIRRFGSAVVPMDDALVLVAVDLGGRSYVDASTDFSKNLVGSFNLENVEHFLRSLGDAGHLNLHVKILSGKDDHHRAEAIFKALGVSLREALQEDAALAGQVPSTKGKI